MNKTIYEGNHHETAQTEFGKGGDEEKMKKSNHTFKDLSRTYFHSPYSTEDYSSHVLTGDTFHLYSTGITACPWKYIQTDGKQK